MSFLLLWTLPVLWLAALAAILLWYLRDIGRLWREPVLRCPVLVLESDDWGAGPPAQATALNDMAALLGGFQDTSGQVPVMSLAVVLSVPDGKAIAAEKGPYQRTCLDEPSLSTVLDALKQGEAEGVFSLQLHASEHFWPNTLMGSVDPKVRSWLSQPVPAWTEELPPHLQSRWTDASSLPSRSLPQHAVDLAVKEEIEIYKRVIGSTPRVVVPPTFIWTPYVERAWAANGIQCIVTPGQRYTFLAADGSHIADGAKFANGDCSGDITYLVRYDYFEPARGRDAGYALHALGRASSEGRPCILENHRVNFCRDTAVHRTSLEELEKLIAGALSLMPTIRFLSSCELLRVLKEQDPQWVARHFNERFPCFWRRLRHSGRLWKLLKLSGLALPGELLTRWALCSVKPSHV
ncbi:MAG: hypothetical protein Q7T97_12865 [Burkholderiaceae bacterium]|nr:hypothetical protein [Burkholderiaceae bacterium]